MNNGKIGVWLIGAWGGVATTVATGLAALEAHATDTCGLVSALPQYSRLDLADWGRFVIGGHEIRKTSYLVEARNLLAKSRVFSAELLAKAAPALDAFDKNVRTGTLINVGSTIESLATAATIKTRGERPAVALARIAADLKEFRAAHSLDHVIVVNLASTEPPMETGALGLAWPELSAILQQADRSPVPASTIYAVAAMTSGCSFLNFTPSVGSNLRALGELAASTGALHMGRDGKTGETLLKSVLAPMFLGTPMTMQLTWQGCDSLLTAPLVLDLVRFCEREHRRGKSGVMTHLSSFFKSPMGTEVHDFQRQLAMLDAWADEVACEN